MLAVTDGADVVATVWAFGLGALLAPLLLGGAAAAYVGSGAVAVTAATGAVTGAGAGWTGWLLAVPGRARDLALANLPATAAAGVATAVVGGSVVAGVALSPDEPVPSDDTGSAATAPASPGQEQAPEPGADGSAARGDGARGDAAPDLDPDRPSDPLDEGSGTPPDGTPTDGGPGEDAPGAPDPGPGPDPGPDPEPEPGPEPDPGPDPEPEPPLEAEGSASSTLGLTWRVVLDVGGIDPGTAGSVRLTSDRPLLALTLDRRCAGLAIGQATCTLGDPAYRFRAVPVPGDVTTLSFVVVTDDGRTRTVRVPLS